MFTGAITALATPLRNREIDKKKLQELVEYQITEGINGLVPCGTTGEAATMDLEEQKLVIRTVVEQARKRVPIIAGASSNATSKALELSKMAADAGADGLLHVTPYYNKPMPSGLVAHFRAIAQATPLPIIIYNVPSRTGCDMQPDTVAAIAQVPGIVGIKEATGSITRGQQIIAACPSHFAVLSGDDVTALALTAMGGAGVISVISNIMPRIMSQMISATREGNLEAARKLHYQMQPLMDLLFIESNPIPVKAALSLKGYTANEVRLPLLPLEGEKLEKLRTEMVRQGLIP